MENVLFFSFWLLSYLTYMILMLVWLYFFIRLYG